MTNLGQPYMDGGSNNSDAFHPSIFAQAGFPGYNNNNNSQLVPAASGLAAGFAQPVYAFAPPLASPAFLPMCGQETAPVESEAVLHQRINEKIDSIIQAQRDSMLNSKIESLSGKVDQLSQNLSYGMDSSEASHIHRLSDKVQQLSQSLDTKNDSCHMQRLSEQVQQLSQSLSQSMQSMQRSEREKEMGELRQLRSQIIEPNPFTSPFSMQAPFEQPSTTYSPLAYSPDRPLHISSEPDSDREISRRLRRLAAESSLRQRSSDSCKIPDW
jgi:hypothetical protein